MEVCHADEDLDDEVVISMGGRSVHSPQQILSDVLRAAVEEDIVKLWTSYTCHNCTAA